MYFQRVTAGIDAKSHWSHFFVFSTMGFQMSPQDDEDLEDENVILW